jgi:flagellar hook-basal body complex protein FliE
MAIAPIGGIAAAAGTTPAAPAGGTTKAGGGFGHLLADAFTKLDATQVQAAKSSEAIATGQSQDISKVAMDIEEASLSLQLAVQVRNKVVDAYNDLFRMQI